MSVTSLYTECGDFMRRKDREINDLNTIKDIIANCNIIRIGLSDNDLYPYIVPMNFGYEFVENIIYFYTHGATSGRKYELINKNKVCSFQMDCDTFLDFKGKDATMRYRSVMGKANIEILQDENKKRGLEILMYNDERTRNLDYDTSIIPNTAVFKLTVTEIIGKISKK